jgi:hypothetical protein
MSTTATSILASLTAQESAGAIKNKTNFIAAQSNGLEDAQVHQMSASALSNLQDQINSLNKALRALAGVTPTSGGTTPTFVSPITFDRHTITANTTITASVLPSSTKQLLVVFVTYSTGGWTLTWNTSTFSVAPTGLSSLAGTRSAIIFADDGGGKWEMVAPPMTGR